MAEQDWKSTLITKLPDIFHFVLTILGIALVVLGIAKGVGYRSWLPVTDLSSRLALGVFGILVIALGLYLKGSGSESALPKASDYDVKILSPRSGDKVRDPHVRGTIKKAIPRDYSLWVFRVYSDAGIWPLRECRINPTGDEWEANSCDIGGVTGDRRAFSVNLVGPDGLALIEYMYEAMERHNQVRAELEKNGLGTNAPYSPTLRKKTRDMLECSRVDVERS